MNVKYMPVNLHKKGGTQKFGHNHASSSHFVELQTFKNQSPPYTPCKHLFNYHHQCIKSYSIIILYIYKYHQLSMVNLCVSLSFYRFPVSTAAMSRVFLALRRGTSPVHCTRPCSKPTSRSRGSWPKQKPPRCQ